MATNEERIRTWILVADGAAARIFLTHPGEPKWLELREFKHPQSRMRGAQLLESPPDMDNGLLPRDREEMSFAHQLAKFLDLSLGRNAYDRLFIVAPPRFLGELRGELTRQVERRIVDCLTEDLVHLSSRELTEHVQVHH
jgi:protein required for attachment to host cells